jgi:hypothetical protein
MLPVRRFSLSRTAPLIGRFGGSLSTSSAELDSFIPKRLVESHYQLGRVIVMVSSLYKITAAFIITTHLLFVPMCLSANDGARSDTISYSALVRESEAKAKMGSDEVEAALEIISAGRDNQSAAEITTRIKTNFPEIAPKATVRVPEEVLDHLIREGDEYRDLQATLRPMLEFYGLEGRVLPVLFQSDMPVVGSSAPNGLMISTRALALLGKEELRGVVAHELCHLVVTDVFRAAIDAQDYRTLRIIELFCDAGAAATMQSLGRDPRSVINGLLKLQQVLEMEFGERDVAGKHPTMSTRIRLSKEVIVRFAPDTRSLM